MLNRSCGGMGYSMHESFRGESDRAAKCEANGWASRYWPRSGVDNRSHSRVTVGVWQVGDAMSSGHVAVALKDVHRDLELKIQPREGI